MDPVSWPESLSFDRDTITTWSSEVNVIEREARKAACEGGEASLFFGGNLLQVHLCNLLRACHRLAHLEHDVDQSFCLLINLCKAIEDANHILLGILQ